MRDRDRKERKLRFMEEWKAWNKNQRSEKYTTEIRRTEKVKSREERRRI